MRRIIPALALALLSTTGCSTEGSTTVSTPSSAQPSSTWEKSSLPGYLDCAAEHGVVKPATISIDCISDSDEITDIEWPQWDEKTALGKGRLDGEEAQVTLLDPIESSTGELVFSDIIVNGKTLSL